MEKADIEAARLRNFCCVAADDSVSRVSRRDARDILVTLLLPACFCLLASALPRAMSKVNQRAKAAPCVVLLQNRCGHV